MHSVRLHMLLAALFAASAQQLDATTHSVSSAAQIQGLYSQNLLQPGDTIEWQNGTYANQVVYLYNSKNGVGVSNITLRAQTPGGVAFSGTSRIFINGDNNVVEGFYFDHSVSSNPVIEFRKYGGGPTYPSGCVLRNCAMNDLSVPNSSSKYAWVKLYGRNHTVENCSFLNKRSTGELILVEVDGINPNYDGVTPFNHTIQRNYIYNIPPKDGWPNSGDSEAIRIGDGNFATANGSCTIRENYFVAADGEYEIITNKSANNRYLYNTFRACRGHLELRHGRNALVEGNFWIGDPLKNSGGVTIVDADHRIVNNYMQGLRNGSDKWNGGIVWVEGNVPSNTDSTQYQRVSNVIVAFNTIYDCEKPVYFQDSNISRGQTYPPQNSFVENNLIYSTLSNLVIQGFNLGWGDGIVDISGISWGTSNVMGGASVGIPIPAIPTTAGDFAADMEIWRPTPASPAINAATGSHLDVVTLDIDGETRLAAKDVGADEISGTLLRRPFTDADVGVSIGAGFLDAAGQLIDPGSGPNDKFPEIATSSLADAILDVGYNEVLQVISGDAPFAWSITAGSLPPGLSLGSSSGTIAGIPAEVGSYAFTVEVSDLDGDTDMQELSLTVIESSPTGNSYLEVGGQVVIEAENFTGSTGTVGNSWETVVWPGASGEPICNAIQSIPNTEGRLDLAGLGPSVSFRIEFQTPGQYFIHLRGTGPDSSSDSVFVTMDGDTSPEGTHLVYLSPDAWVWKKDSGAKTFSISPGIHTIEIWMREPGSVVDKVVVNLLSAQPSGNGPVASPKPEILLSYSQWKIGRFGVNTQSDSLDDEPDGYTLLEEYFWNLSPRVIDQNGLRPLGLASQEALGFKFRVRPDTADIHLLMEGSSNLVDWGKTVFDSDNDPLPNPVEGWSTLNKPILILTKGEYLRLRFELVR